jgi:hypothetical protein
LQAISSLSQDQAATDEAALEGGHSKRQRLNPDGDAPGDAEQRRMLQSPPMGDGAVNEPAAVESASQNAAHAVCPLCLGLLQTVIAPEDSSGSSQSLCSVELITTVSSLNDPSRQAATALAGAAEAPGGGSSNTNAAIVERRCVAMPSLVAVAASIAAEYDMESFALEVSLPASLAVRHQALVWHLRKQQPQQQQQDSSAGVFIAKELAAAVGETWTLLI